MAQGKSQGKGKKAMAHNGTRPRKPARPGTVKKYGKKVDMAEFRAQLDAFGLKIVEVTADGNCFFRCLADQLEGSEEGHTKFRAMVVQYIADHREEFEPFIEDEVPFDEYCHSMEKDGTWAGHMELQAGSLVSKRNICIHMLNSPRWYINNFSDHDAKMIHLSYHDGQHYNSVRLKDDPCLGPALPVYIKVDANISVTNDNHRVTTNGSKKHTERSSFESIKLVMDGTGCTNIAKVEQILRAMDGDVDDAIEYLIATGASDTEDDESSLFMDYTSIGDEHQQVGGSLYQPEANGYHHFATLATDVEPECRPGTSQNGQKQERSHAIPSETNQNVQNPERSHTSPSGTNRNGQKPDRPHAEKKASKMCSCGSAKNRKHKCSSVVTRPSVAPAIKGKGTSAKGRKMTKQKQTKQEPEVAPPVQDKPVPDLGSLCI